MACAEREWLLRTFCSYFEVLYKGKQVPWDNFEGSNAATERSDC